MQILLVAGLVISALASPPRPYHILAGMEQKANVATESPLIRWVHDVTKYKSHHEMKAGSRLSDPPPSPSLRCSGFHPRAGNIQPMAFSDRRRTGQSPSVQAPPIVQKPSPPSLSWSLSCAYCCHVVDCADVSHLEITQGLGRILSVRKVGKVNQPMVAESQVDPGVIPRRRLGVESLKMDYGNWKQR
ncbi:hypothetical protein BJ170DRAFT_621580 [Xylariales sp. AK1849]|nr:hypothetical protein BJ170DRAFT_621580 [Xylariales sp. AK1849]